MKTLIKLLLLCPCFLFSPRVYSQNLMVENFETTMPGWTFQAVTGSNWFQGAGSAISGTQSLRCNGSAMVAPNAWAFTPALNLQAGKKYRLSYWFKGPVSGYQERLKITMGTAATVASQNAIIHDYPAVTSNVYQEGIDTVIISSTGNYYFAFNFYSQQYMNGLNLDSVVVRQVNNSDCIASPVILQATAPETVGAGNPFTLSLTGDYSHLNGLQFQWQSSQPGANNFQDISGGNVQHFTATQTVSMDYRCKVTCNISGGISFSNILNVSVPASGSFFRDKFIGNTDINQHTTGMSFLNASTGFVSFVDRVGFTQDSGQTYINRPVNTGNTNFNGYPVNITFGFSANGVHAFSMDSLLLYGDYGAEPAILFSTNGGQSWKVVFHQAFSGDIANGILDMKFPSNALGVAITQKYIIETTNRGQVWTVRYQVPTYRNSVLAKIAMPSATMGFISGGSFFYRRINGNWNEMVTNGLSTNIGLQYNQISFTSETTGYILRDDNGGIYKTTNAAINWTLVNHLQDMPFPLSSDMHFTNDSTGFFATKFSYNVLKTSNAGRTWEICKRSSSYQQDNFGMNRLFFLNKNTGWAGGRGEFLMMTNSAGNPTSPKAIFTIDTTTLQSNSQVWLKTGSYPFYTHQWYKNGTLISNSNSNFSFTHSLYESIDTIMLVVNNGAESDTMIRYQEYSFVLPPEITSFTPTTAASGSTITINGFGFRNTSSVSFGGTPAANFTVNSPTSITAVLGGGLTGAVSIITPNGTGTKAGFQHLLPPPPVITDVQPRSGNIGSSITITGYNFSGDTAGTVVYFGKLKAKILTATTTGITCKVPAGAAYERIAVVNIYNSLSGESADYFAVTVPGAATLSQLSFSRVLNLPSDPVVVHDIYPLKVLSGDFDGDGKNDLLGSVRYNLVNDSIYIYRNISMPGNIGFAKRHAVGVGFNTAIADFNGDGKPDICYVDKYATVGILINQSSPGNFVFAAPITIPMTNGPRRVAAGDLNGDGRPDLLVSGFSNARLCVFLNISYAATVAFSPVTEFAVPGPPINVAIGDVSGDGIPDMIAANYLHAAGTCYISVFKNLGGTTLSFAAPVNMAVPCGTDNTNVGSTSDIYVADLNNDGNRDIIFTNITSTPLSLFRNTTTGSSLSFAARQDYGNQVNSVATCGILSNFRGLALPDYATSRYYDYTFNIFGNESNTSQINFSGNNIYGNNGDLWSITASDFDGDGKQDVAVATAYGVPTGNRGFHIYRNRMGETIPSMNCTGTTPISITCNLTGPDYQWQVDSGNGFQNITNGPNYNNTTTRILSVISAPPQWYGYKYRCLVNGNASEFFELKFQNTWTGAVNNNWEEPGNWSCGHPPGQYEDAIIMNGTVNIQSNAIIRSLFAGASASITVGTGFTLNILN